ncbi:hypothetical protein [Actibacterium lipolyticum]|uniref:Uncharacterized protein n=1 Tax=Actibacterium lipolyticum TaxID=1524263 RepID=A0A238KUD1_9RHOB|nr:hypothetical protein [Actibacterium lipolyticum]SMX46395.1 hypothetical protein COL8621_03094 [Actibacterium lipolyticum]
MKRTITASLLAATLALGSITAVPAYASSSSDKALKTAVGALLLFGIANELSRGGSSSSPKPVHSTPYNKPQDWPQHPGYAKKKRKPSVIPLQCLHSVSAPKSKRRDTRHIVTERCLRREGFRGSLPGQCHTTYPTSKGYYSGYSANCLTKKGYVIGRTRN